MGHLIKNQMWLPFKNFVVITKRPLLKDTHDYCDLKVPFEKNMVLTVEPGIYIKEEDFGIRLC